MARTERAAGRAPVAAPLSRAERRRLAEVRRGRFFLVVAVVLAAVALVAWFPATSLLHERQALAATTGQVRRLTQQDRALAREEQRLQSPAEVARIAREQYQLVAPGQQAYQVLPPNGAAGSSTAAYAGDPGLQRPVTPSAAAELPPGSVGVTTTTGPGGTARTGRTGSAATGEGATTTPPTSLWSRITQTLEFWH